MDKISYIQSKQLVKSVAAFDVGDTVRVFTKIQEEGKTRLQAFEGTVMRFKGSGMNKVFTVRRISYGEGVEKTFPFNAPSVDHVNLVKRGKVRRAKLYYLRKKIGKKSKIESENMYLHSADKPQDAPGGEKSQA